MADTIKIKDAKSVTITTDGAQPAAKSAARWDGQTVAGLLVKAEEERHYTLVLAYPADKADIGKAADGHRDFVSKSALEDAAWNYMLKSRQVVPAHFTDVSAGDVVESYIYRGPDWAVKAADGSEHAISDGDWLMGIRWSPEAWAAIKQGHIRGVSPEGKVQRRKPSASAVAALRS